MGSRPATLSEGGGKFNNVDGVITNYEFTTVHPFARAERRRSSNFNPLYGVLTARMDGAEEPDVDVLLVGSANDFKISDKGKTLTPVDGASIWAKSQWGKFIASLEKAGCETENSDYEDGVFNYEPIIGRRVRFVQEQQFDKSGKLKTRKGKGRDGKERDYNDTTTVVLADYGVVLSTPVDWDRSRPPSQGKTVTSPVTHTIKGSTRTTTATRSGKSNGAPTEVFTRDVDLTSIADEALVSLLEKFGGSSPKSKLVSAPAQLFLKKNFAEHADEIRKILYDDDYINTAVERGIIMGYEQSGKQQMLTA